AAGRANVGTQYVVLIRRQRAEAEGSHRAGWFEYEQGCLCQGNCRAVDAEGQGNGLVWREAGRVAVLEATAVGRDVRTQRRTVAGRFACRQPKGGAQRNAG